MECVNLPKALDSMKVEHEDLPPREGTPGERRNSMYCTLRYDGPTVLSVNWCGPWAIVLSAKTLAA